MTDLRPIETILEELCQKAVADDPDEEEIYWGFIVSDERLLIEEKNENGDSAVRARMWLKKNGHAFTVERNHVANGFEFAVMTRRVPSRRSPNARKPVRV